MCVGVIIRVSVSHLLLGTIPSPSQAKRFEKLLLLFATGVEQGKIKIKRSPAGHKIIFL